MLTNPMLPPKAGYVEVEVNGHRTYKNITTGILIEDEPELSGISELSSTAELEQRLTALESAIERGLNL